MVVFADASILNNLGIVHIDVGPGSKRYEVFFIKLLNLSFQLINVCLVITLFMLTVNFNGILPLPKTSCEYNLLVLKEGTMVG